MSLFLLVHFNYITVFPVICLRPSTLCGGHCPPGYWVSPILWPSSSPIMGADSMTRFGSLYLTFPYISCFSFRRKIIFSWGISVSAFLLFSVGCFPFMGNLYLYLVLSPRISLVDHFLSSLQFLLVFTLNILSATSGVWPFFLSFLVNDCSCLEVFLILIFG